jgi:hypothetical protein
MSGLCPITVYVGAIRQTELRRLDGISKPFVDVPQRRLL